MRRISLKFGIDFIIVLLATPLAYLMRTEWTWSNAETVLWLSLLLVPLKAAILLYEKFFLQSWHRSGLRDLFSLIRGVSVYTVLFLGAAVLFRTESFVIPYSIPFIEGMLLVLGLGGVRLLSRLLYEYRYRNTSGSESEKKRVLIAGAGESGTMIAREMLRHPGAGMEPIGFVDDDYTKRKQRFLGLSVLGTTREVEEVVKEQQVDMLLIAMPSESGKVIRAILDVAKDSEVECKIIPPIQELLSGQVSVNQIRDVDVEDLLRREPAKLNTKEIAGYLAGKKVLVTGAGGSIGSEIVRQITSFNPDKLLLLDKSEYNIYKLEQELSQQYPDLDYKPLIADVRDINTLESIFRRHNPEVIFHAAAYKHVPLLEENPAQAILNNTGGTKNLVDLALETGVEHFVNVSTDKAVNPTSIMGASKRIAEYIVEWGSREAADDQIFVSVRFGNVLGSSGSVVPKFKQQIRNREPITVTHPDMTRYFMTIPEASQLVLQAGGLEESGAVYVLDMGEPVKILDLAKDLVRLSGLEPDIDVPIEITGIRPGEKLYEELLTSEENTMITRYTKIHSAKQNGLPIYFKERLDDLMDFALANNELGLKKMLGELIVVNKLSPQKEAVSN